MDNADYQQLQFLRLDLGFVYTDGWKSGKVRTDSYESDCLIAKPELVVGGRLPHFWIRASPDKKFSSLDLPSLMTHPDGTPQYVLFHCGSISKDFHKMEKELRNKY
jgi:hypothetical protein